jgi:hypothetical protein
MINANNKHYVLQYQCLSDSLLPTLQMDHLKFRYFVQKLQFVTAMINSVEQLALQMYRLKFSYYFYFF